MSVRVLHGDCREVLKALEPESVNCCLTSPPYFGLRSYLPAAHPDKALEIGAELTPDEYVAALVGVFREVRRVLRKDGVLWVNIGDSYAGSWGSQGHRETPAVLSRNSIASHPKRASQTGQIRQAGLKPKDLIGIPWMLAFALRADGWWLRGDHVWGKPNGMPESTRDRPTRSHEYVFLLTKSANYWYDQEAVRTAPKASTITQLAKPYTGQSTKNHESAGVQDASDLKRRIVEKMREPPSPKYEGGNGSNQKEDIKARYYEGLENKQHGHSREQQIEGGNLRSVWWVSPAQYREGHFAVMPNLVAEICILAGCPAGGTVLDPFSGAGTTSLVADRLGRNAIGIELNHDFTKMADARVRRDAGMFASVSA